MKTGTAALKVGFTVALAAAVGYGGFKFVAKGVGREQGFEVWALFRDAAGLVDKSRVVVAGITIGEIHQRSLQGHLARVNIKIKSNVELWSNAAVYKKSASLLGEFFLEIDPGTPSSPDPLTGEAHPNYKLDGCEKITGDADCSRIKNVIEAITLPDVMAQVQETLPVLRDILRDVEKVTQGPMQEIAKELQTGVRLNSMAAEKLLTHIDDIVQDVHGVTAGPAVDDLQHSMKNVRQITEDIKGILGNGEGQLNTTSDKIKRDLDQLAVTLDKVNRALDTGSNLVESVAKGGGTIGKLLTDDTIARNVTDVSDDVSAFVKSLTRLQTIVSIREEAHLFPVGGGVGANFKTYLELQLMPTPDKYYLIELVDEPRGTRTITSQYQATTTGSNPNTRVVTNTATVSSSSQFKISFMFAKRMEFAHSMLGITGRLGIKESTGGIGVDLDTWHRRLKLTIDLFDFSSEPLPRLKIWLALEIFKHAWLVAGVDDIMNDNADPRFAGITCTDPVQNTNQCHGGRDYFFGAQLTFNDEDLRALLAVGGSALSGAAK